jgi:3-deoxy-D-manno-octulosonate 8-phosphate phosphatase (KDO 8-P phosphatase)
LTVNDACDEVKSEVDYITKCSGGKGAVREAIEFILKSQGKWETVIQKYYSV